MRKQIVKLLYDGDAVRDGSIDVRILAPALLSFGALCERANKVFNEDRVNMQINVRADFQPGSFDVFIQVIQSLPSQVSSFIAGHQLTKTAEILSILGFIGGSAKGLIALIRWLNGRKPDGISIQINGDVHIHVDNSVMETSQKTYALFQDPSLINELKNTLSPLTWDGIDTLKISGDEQEPISITKEDLSSFAQLPFLADSAELLDHVSPAILEIIKPSFRTNMKWEVGVPDGGKLFVEMKDREFSDSVQSGAISFKKGDLLKVQMHTKIIQTSTGTRAEHAIIKVESHIHSIPPYYQPPLLDDPGRPTPHSDANDDDEQPEKS